MEANHENFTSNGADSGNAITANSTDECNTIKQLLDVEFKKTDVPVHSRFVVLLEPIMLIYALYIGAAGPLSAQYIRARMSNNYNLTDDESVGDQDLCSNGSSRHENDNIDSQASLLILYINVAGLVPGMFSLILLGSYSDRGGRKVAIIAPQVGAIVKCVSFFAVICFDLSLYVVVVATFIEGLSGGIFMTLAAGYSYVADITSYNRSLRMAILESCYGIGIVVSQVILGYLITSLGYYYPFLILTALLLLDLVVTACLLPETVTRHPDVRFWTFHHFRKAYHLYTRDNGTGRRWKLLLCLAIAFCTCAVTLGRTDVLIIYLLDAPFCWSSVLIGYFGAVFMLICAPTSVLLIKLTQPKLSDSHLLLLATISAAAYQAVVVFSRTTAFMFMATVAGGASYLVTPMVRSISSKVVKQEEEGAMLATTALAITVSVLVGMLVFNNLYSATVFVWAPFTFVIMLGLLCFTILLAVVFVVKEKVEKKCLTDCDERTQLLG